MSSFNTPWFNSQDSNFFNSLNRSQTPHVILTAETEDFDESVTQQWIDEGFDAHYIPLLTGGKDFVSRLHKLGDSFGVGEQYAIVAFGASASLALSAHTQPNTPRLVAIVAYYPTSIPSIRTKFPQSVQIVVHLPVGAEIQEFRTPSVLGIQGNRQKGTRKRITRGSGYGQALPLEFPAYTYEGVEAGFAENDLDEFDRVAAGVAWTRSLAAVKKGFRIENSEIESVRDGFVDASSSGDIAKSKGFVRQDAKVLYTPTLTGGVGKTDLERFYKDFFRSSTDAEKQKNALKIRLLSRTVGTDRVVDEMQVSLTHASEIPWLLPGVSATGKRIEIVLVSIFHVRGKRLVSEHIYWDQASVLVQAGLLDPKLVNSGSGAMMKKKKDGKGLPVRGAESARAIGEDENQHVNELIPGW